MSLQTRQQRERRALNIVWTAANDYHFLPEFLSFQQDGTPDIFLNAIIGLVHKHYDDEKIKTFVEEMDSSIFSRTFHDLFWIGLENAVVDREQDFVLNRLRKNHAKNFLYENKNLDVSMQRLMMRDDIAHTIKAAHCRNILGEKLALYNPWERKLYQALQKYSGQMETDEIISYTKEIFKRFFVFKFGMGENWTPLLKFSVKKSLAEILKKFLTVEHLKATQDGSKQFFDDEKNFGAANQDDAKNLFQQTLKKFRLSDKEKVERMFSASIFSPREVQNFEEEFCTDTHKKQNLFFASQRKDFGQRKANQDFFLQRRSIYQTTIRQMTRQIQNTLEAYRQPIPLPAKFGHTLAMSNLWKAAYLHDDKIFSEKIFVPHPKFSVTLLLDASYSRIDQQGSIATQAYILAKTFAQCGIALQILSYCSFAGYTILHLMKSFEMDDVQNVFDYMAYGWNRDGLAFRAIKIFLPKATHEHTPLLLVLSDARPSDDRDIAQDGVKLAQRYADDLAKEDTAKEIKNLRYRGVRVIGVIQSEVANAEEDAKKIFGRDFVRIDKIEKLAHVIAEKISLQIRTS